MRLDWQAFGGWVSKQQAKNRPPVSDRELARRVGLSPTHIGYLKKGRSGTTMENVEAIAEALGSTQREAMTVLMPPRFSGESSDIATLLDPIVSKAPPGKRQAVLDAIVENAEWIVKIAAA